jgi:hypothetical protein
MRALLALALLFAACAPLAPPQRAGPGAALVERDAARAEMQAAVRALRTCQYVRRCEPWVLYEDCYRRVQALCSRRGEPPGCWQEEGMLYEPFGDASWGGPDCGRRP